MFLKLGVSQIDVVPRPCVIDPVQQALEIAALVEAPVSGIKAVLEAIAGDTAGVVVGRAVGEPVGHHEVERLVGDRSAQRVLADERAAGRCTSSTNGSTGGCDGEAGSKQDDNNATEDMPPPH